MATSQNHYKANDRSLIATYTIPGTSIKLPLRKGDASVVLLYVAQQYNIHVEQLKGSQCGGFVERNIRGSSTTLSNHASGTAIDLNWGAHPLGATGTYSGSQLEAIRVILSFLEGAVRFGGNYSGRKDPMHFEINVGTAKLNQIANKVRAKNAGKPVPAAVAKPAQPKPKAPSVPKFPGNLRRGSKGSGVKTLQARLNARGYHHLTVDGDMGDGTVTQLKRFQAFAGVKQDGICGSVTWGKLYSLPIK